MVVPPVTAPALPSITVMPAASITAHAAKTLLVAACALALAAGCSRSIDRALADVSRSDDVQHGDTFTFPADPLPIDMSAAAMDLPADFPEDIYRPGAYQLIASDSRDGLRRVQLRTGGATGQVGELARSAMLRQGWRPVMSRQHGDSQRVLAFIKDRRTAVLTFNGVEPGQVRVGVQWRH